MQTIPTFKEKPLENESPRCVDGRPSENSPQGPQMLGGSLHILLLGVLFQDKNFDESTITHEAHTLIEKGFKIGAHRGSHREHDKSDCGFADRLKDILKTAQDNRSIIKARLTDIYHSNKNSLEIPNLPPFEELLESAYERLSHYDTEKIMITGENLLSSLHDAIIETVEGNHEEQVAFVNIKRGVTLDTRALNKEGFQAFNMDMAAVNLQGGVLDIPLEFTIPISLILYMATEMVLVEQKGKPALPIVIHE